MIISLCQGYATVLIGRECSPYSPFQIVITKMSQTKAEVRNPMKIRPATPMATTLGRIGWM